MKKYAALLLLMFAAVAFGTDVTFNLADFTTDTANITNRNVQIVPQSTPRTNATNLILSSDRKVYTTDYQGSFTVTNMTYGNYLVTLLGPFAKTEFRILVPSGSDATNAVNLLVTSNSVPSESAGYTQSGADARFVNVNSDWASNLVVTNLVLRGSTNAFTFTNGASAGQFLKTDGTNWFAGSAAGGGDALIADGLNQFAASPTIGGTNIIQGLANLTGATNGLDAGKQPLSSVLTTLSGLTGSPGNIIVNQSGSGWVELAPGGLTNLLIYNGLNVGWSHPTFLVNTNAKIDTGTNFITAVSDVGTPASGDLLPIVDVSTAERKYVSIANLPTGGGSAPANVIIWDTTPPGDVGDVAIAADDSGTNLTWVTSLPIANGGTGAGTATTARSNLGLSIDGDVLGYNHDLYHWKSIPPPAAPSVALGAGTGLTGDYTWWVTFVTAQGETELGTISGVLSPVNQDVNLTSIPVSPDARVTARKIYRTDNSGAGPPFYLVTTINNNTATTYTDNTDEGSLTSIPVARINTAGTWLMVQTNKFMHSAANNIYIGTNAGVANIHGTANIFIGDDVASSLTNGASSVAIGDQAFRDANYVGNSVAIGDGALRYLVYGFYHVALGQDALGRITHGQSSVAIGRDAAFDTTNSSHSVFVGDFAGENHESGDHVIFIGSQSGGFGLTDVVSNSIAIGYGARVSSTNQLVIGGTNLHGRIETVYLGNGVTNTSPTSVTVAASGGFGTDNQGADLLLAGGRSTGSKDGGTIHFLNTAAGASASTLRSWTTNFSITSTGIIMPQLTASRALVLDSSGTITAATGTPDGTKFLRDDGSYQSIPGGGDALTSNPLSQFAATTSSQLAGVISDETGSGLLVFATSPTLTTPNLGVATATSVTMGGTNVIEELAKLHGVTNAVVSGPGSSVDNEIPRFNGTSGYLVQGSGAFIDDTTNLTVHTLSTTAGAAGGISLFDSAGTRKAMFSAPSALTSNTLYTLPAVLADGVFLNTLSTDSNSTLSIVGTTGSGTFVRSTSPTFAGTPVINLASITSSGDLPVADGGTGAGSHTAGNVLFGAGTSAITNLATTGSGNVVRATSPSLTTPDLGAATATSVTIGSTNLLQGIANLNAISNRVPALVTNSLYVSAGAMGYWAGSTADGGKTAAAIGQWTNGVTITDTWDFDSTTNECVSFQWAPGPGFTGKFLATVIYGSTNTAMSGSSNVVWQIGVQPLELNTTPGQPIYFTNATGTLTSSNTVQRLALPLISMTNFTSDAVMNFRFGRLGTNTADVLVGDARLIGLRIGWERTNSMGGY